MLGAPLRIAIVGLGTGGQALAILLARRGHQVTLLEREPDPRPVGVGIWLQDLGQQVLDRLGLLDQLRASSRPVSRISARTVGGRTVMDFGYRDLPGSVPALGVHRGRLFALLLATLRAEPVDLRTGVTVRDVRPTAGGASVVTDTGTLTGQDLVIGADGATSTVRRALGVATRDHAYSYGAWWAVVDDPDELAGEVLYQCFDGTSAYLGVLPTAQRQASIFWSAKVAAGDVLDGADVRAWRARARPFAGPYEPLLAEVDQLLPAVYRDVVVRTPYLAADRSAAVLIGDAAHAMSPQLGVGTSLALADAWALDRHLHSHAELRVALAAYTADRARHVRWYQWCTRLLGPVFQSDLQLLAYPRDLLAPGVLAIPAMRRQAVRALLGDQTSPRGTWRLDPSHRR